MSEALDHRRKCSWIKIWINSLPAFLYRVNFRNLEIVCHFWIGCVWENTEEGVVFIGDSLWEIWHHFIKNLSQQLRFLKFYDAPGWWTLFIWTVRNDKEKAAFTEYKGIKIFFFFINSQAEKIQPGKIKGSLLDKGVAGIFFHLKTCYSDT